MRFNKHFELEGRHAFLAPSKPSWLSYSDDKLALRMRTALQARRGDDLHQLAYDLIRLRQKLEPTGQTLNMYVNDAIGYRMTPEQPLFYSDNCFGTADALGFSKNRLRVSDLKTGLIPAKALQLDTYCALFCLEYRFNPMEIEMETRIYQNDAIVINEPEPDHIFAIMQKIKYLDKQIQRIKEEDLS